jgi:hypothetical protein
MIERLRALPLGLLGLLGLLVAVTASGAALAEDGASRGGAHPAGCLVAAAMPPPVDAAVRSEPQIVRAPWTNHRLAKLRLVAGPAHRALSGPALARREVVAERSAPRPGLAGRSLLAGGRAPPAATTA